MTSLDCTIAVATFGEPSWKHLARRRAVPSATAQGVPVVYVHGATLAAARNEALAEVATRYVIALDADDELEAGYVAALAAGTADVRAPAVRYVHDNRPAAGIPPAAVMPTVSGHHHDCGAECLLYGNWLVVGAMVRADLLRAVGGWRDYPVYEDWATWLHCHLAGATFESIPAAVYRAYVRRSSRNRSASQAVKLAAHRAIALDAGLAEEYVPAPAVPAAVTGRRG